MSIKSLWNMDKGWSKRKKICCQHYKFIKSRYNMVEKQYEEKWFTEVLTKKLCHFSSRENKVYGNCLIDPATWSNRMNSIILS